MTCSVLSTSLLLSRRNMYVYIWINLLFECLVYYKMSTCVPDYSSVSDSDNYVYPLSWCKINYFWELRLGFTLLVIHDIPCLNSVWVTRVLRDWTDKEIVECFCFQPIYELSSNVDTCVTCSAVQRKIGIRIRWYISGPG